jgi:hypothetical protein
MRMPRYALSALAGVVLMALPATAQDAPSQPPPADAPAQPDATTSADQMPVLARVIEVTGDVKWAPLGTEDWKPVQLNDELPERTKILTGARSSVKLQMGEEEPYTAVLIDAVGKTVISEAFKTRDTKRIRLGVGYGQIRAGVAEGGLKSDFTIDSPVATLSKRGTWNFGLFYERGTDRFQVFLLDRGLVDVLNKLTAQRRGVQPGELVTQAMRMFLDQAELKNVPVADVLGQSDVEVAFNRIQNDGLGVVDPSQGRAVFINLSNATAADTFANLAERSLLQTPPLFGQIQPGRVVAEEGFFGTGRGDDLVAVLLDQNNPLVRDGFAKAGRYSFRRAALEGWLKDHRK